MTDENGTPVGPNPDGPGERVGPGGRENEAAEEDNVADEQAGERSAQEAIQAAQQAAQAARQATQQAEQAVQAAQQAARGVGAETSGATIATEIGPAGSYRAWAANFKRTYDEFQDISLVAARRSQQEYDAMRQASYQALQNAVETANMVGKQAVRHNEFAMDRLWSGTDATEARGDARTLAGRPDDVVAEED